MKRHFLKGKIRVFKSFARWVTFYGQCFERYTLKNYVFANHTFLCIYHLFFFFFFLFFSHKNWHVWNRENVEKVLVDERKHREKEEQERIRREFVASERRRNVLRAKKAGGSAAGNNEPSANSASIASSGAPSDIVADSRDAYDDNDNDGADGIGATPRTMGGFHVRDVLDFPPPTTTRNAEYEAESKAKRDKFEKEFLKRYMAEDHVPTPWYAKPTSTIDELVAKADDDARANDANNDNDDDDDDDDDDATEFEDDGTTTAGAVRDARDALKAKARAIVKKQRTSEELAAIERRKRTEVRPLLRFSDMIARSHFCVSSIGT